MVICHVFHEYVYHYDSWTKCCYILIHEKITSTFKMRYVECLHIYDDLFRYFQHTISYLSIEH